MICTHSREANTTKRSEIEKTAVDDGEKSTRKLIVLLANAGFSSMRNTPIEHRPTADGERPQLKPARNSGEGVLKRALPKLVGGCSQQSVCYYKLRGLRVVRLGDLRREWREKVVELEGQSTTKVNVIAPYGAYVSVLWNKRFITPRNQ